MDRVEILNKVKSELQKVAIYDAAEAEWLVCLALDVKRSELYQKSELSKSEERKVFSFLRKRKRHIPLSQIVKNSEFYGYTFNVNKNVLTPRPETEQLVERVIKDTKPDDKILDIGTGSGAIAITLSKRTNVAVTATDISQKALRVARKNAKELNADIEIIRSNLFSNLAGRKFDKIVSNPPYISEGEFKVLDEEVKCHEPKIALVAKDNGLEIYKKIISEAPRYLEEKGQVYFEIGETQANALKKFLEKGFTRVEIIKDLEGKDRIITAVKK